MFIVVVGSRDCSLFTVYIHCVDCGCPAYTNNYDGLQKNVVICYAINGSLNCFISAVSDSGDSLLLSFSMCVQLFP